MSKLKFYFLGLFTGSLLIYILWPKIYKTSRWLLGFNNNKEHKKPLEILQPESVEQNVLEIRTTTENVQTEQKLSSSTSKVPVALPVLWSPFLPGVQSKLAIPGILSNIVVMDISQNWLRLGQISYNVDSIGPSICMPLIVGKASKFSSNPNLWGGTDLLLGDEALARHVARDVQQEKLMQKEIVKRKNMDLLHAVMLRGMAEQSIDPKERSVVCVVAPPVNRIARDFNESLIQRLFESEAEDASVLGVYMVCHEQASCFANQIWTGLGVYLGEGRVGIVPVVFGVPMLRLYRSFSITGDDINEKIASSMPWDEVASSLGRADAATRLRVAQFLRENYLTVKTKESGKIDEGINASKSKETRIQKDIQNRKRFLRAPDEQFLNRLNGDWLPQIMEVFFNPEGIKREPVKNDQGEDILAYWNRLQKEKTDEDPIHFAILEVVLCSPPELRPYLLENIVVSGPLSTIPGFSERLKMEIEQQIRNVRNDQERAVDFPATGDQVHEIPPQWVAQIPLSKCRVGVISGGNEGNILSWMGTAATLKYEWFVDRIITREMYDTIGDVGVARMCFQ